jgi:ribonuclease BN (tRNA processing enzyme)
MANLLLDRVKAQLKKWGFDRMRGPASPSSNENYGVQITGFDFPPVILTLYIIDLITELMTNYGLYSIQELYAYRIGKDAVEHNIKLNKPAEQIKERSGLELVELSKKNLKRDLHAFKDLWNQAWKPNHGFVPQSIMGFQWAKAFYFGK